MEIGTFVQKAITSELSGNMIDICPVGALTSKPYAFAARPWELRRVESIDVLDAVGSHIKIETRGREVMRITPRLCEDINEEWISDRTRFAYDGLAKQRLDRPYLRREGALVPVDWEQALATLAARIKQSKGERLAALAGDLCPMEAQYALVDLLNQLGCPHRDCRQDGAVVAAAAGTDYLFNTTIAGLEKVDALLLVGSNPRWEATMVNARIRKQWLTRRLPVASIGPALDLGYPAIHLGTGPAVLRELLAAPAGRETGFAKTLAEAQHPAFIVGMGALARPDGAAVHAAARALADRYGLMRDDWQGFNLLHTAAARVGGLMTGFVPTTGGLARDGILQACAAGEIDLLWLLGADEIPFDDLGDTFVVYQGHHGDRGAARADLILPDCAYTEQSATFANTEGRVQRTLAAVTPPGQAKEAWRVIRALSQQLGCTLGYDDVAALRAAHPAFALSEEDLSWVAKVSQGVDGKTGSKTGGSDRKKEEGREKMTDAPFILPITDYYRVDPITRASATMAACARALAQKKTAKRARKLTEATVS